ncbi:MAG: winged helix-turn-helix domain-containing protein [Nitrososphaerales archaeon]
MPEAYHVPLNFSPVEVEAVVRDSACLAILEGISNEGPTFTDLLRIVNLQRKALSRHLKHLEGLVKHVGPSRKSPYELTPRGRQELNAALFKSLESPPSKVTVIPGKDPHSVVVRFPQSLTNLRILYKKKHPEALQQTLELALGFWADHFYPSPHTPKARARIIEGRPMFVFRFPKNEFTNINAAMKYAEEKKLYELDPIETGLLFVDRMISLGRESGRSYEKILSDISSSGSFLKGFPPLEDIPEDTISAVARLLQEKGLPVNVERGKRFVKIVVEKSGPKVEVG